MGNSEQCGPAFAIALQDISASEDEDTGSDAGDTDNGTTAAPEKPQTIRAQATRKGIKLTWTKVLEATGYRLHRAASKDGGRAEDGAYSKIADLNAQDCETDGLYPLMHQAAELAIEAGELYKTYNDAMSAQEEIEADFLSVIGDLLKEGYWNNANYGAGQEQYLYDDAVELMNRMSYPEVKYQVSRVS